MMRLCLIAWCLILLCLASAPVLALSVLPDSVAAGTLSRNMTLVLNFTLKNTDIPDPVNATFSLSLNSSALASYVSFSPSTVRIAHGEQKNFSAAIANTTPAGNYSFTIVMFTVSDEPTYTTTNLAAIGKILASGSAFVQFSMPAAIAVEQPQSTPEDDGGGGGGGGVGIVSRPTISLPSIRVVPSFFTERLSPQIVKKSSFTIINEGTKTPVSLHVDEHARPWLHLEQRSFILDKNDTVSVALFFDTTYLSVGNYSTQIIVSTNQSVITIPVHLEVVSAVVPFRVHVTILDAYKKISSGSPIIALVDITGPEDPQILVLHYGVFSDREHVGFDEQMIFNGSLTTFRTINLPALSSGVYQFRVIVVADDEILSASDSFDVVAPLETPLDLGRIAVPAIIVAIIGVVIELWIHRRKRSQ